MHKYLKSGFFLLIGLLGFSTYSFGENCKITGINKLSNGNISYDFELSGVKRTIVDDDGIFSLYVANHLLVQKNALNVIDTPQNDRAKLVSKIKNENVASSDWKDIHEFIQQSIQRAEAALAGYAGSNSRMGQEYLHLKNSLVQMKTAFSNPASAKAMKVSDFDRLGQWLDTVKKSGQSSPSFLNYSNHELFDNDSDNPLFYVSSALPQSLPYNNVSRSNFPCEGDLGQLLKTTPKLQNEAAAKPH